MDTQRLGQLMAEFMESAEAEDYPEGTEVDEALILATISVPDGDGHRQHIRVRCTSESPVVQAGLIAWGEDAVMAVGFEDEDPE